MGVIKRYNQMGIRKMKIEDIEFVHSICDKESFFQASPNFHSSWSKEELESWINSKDDVLLVAEEKEKIIGFFLISYHKPTRKATRENLWVSEKHRRKGVAQKLFEEGLKKIQAKGSDYICGMTEKDNLNMLNFLQKNGVDKGHLFYWMGKRLWDRK